MKKILQLALAGTLLICLLTVTTQDTISQGPAIWGDVVDPANKVLTIVIPKAGQNTGVFWFRLGNTNNFNVDVVGWVHDITKIPGVSQTLPCPLPFTLAANNADYWLNTYGWKVHVSPQAQPGTYHVILRFLWLGPGGITGGADIDPYIKLIYPEDNPVMPNSYLAILAVIAVGGMGYVIWRRSRRPA